MPAIITHDTFGREIYSKLTNVIGHSEDEKNAFLLGCQGPDVFFYGAINPRIQQANSVGKKLHRSYCSEFIAALVLGVSRVREVSEDEEEEFKASAEDIARAYVLGYLMHFELDAKVHPFVFSQQYSYCDAGVPGLNRSSQSEVHVEIECELDELVLTVKRGETIATFDPSTQILKGSDRVLDIISALYDFALPISHKIKPAKSMFRLSTKAYRQAERWLYSSTGVKRDWIGRFELLFRQHSYLRAMTHKNVRIFESIFDNHEHYEWPDPWVKGEKHSDSFWDLYNSALESGIASVQVLSDTIDNLAAKKEGCNGESTIAEAKNEIRISFKTVLDITMNLNFYGCNESIIDPETGKPEFQQ